jgi:hypothetical protein
MWGWLVGEKGRNNLKTVGMSPEKSKRAENSHEAFIFETIEWHLSHLTQNLNVNYLKF